MNYVVTTLYVLFQEYTDQGRQPSAPFVNGKDFPLDDGCYVHGLMDKCFGVVDYFCHEEVQKLYDENNVKGLLYQYSELSDEYPGKEVEFLSQLQRHGFTDWDDVKKENEENVIYGDWDVTEHLIGDMTHREKSDGHTILLNIEALETADGVISVRCNHNSILLKVCETIPKLHLWISENRAPQRLYCYNKKHGDAYHLSQVIQDGRGLRAAQLETNESETNELLKLAVGRSRDSELWYWDENRKKFIYFENQNTINPPSFHAYHLKMGEKNSENIDVEKLSAVLTVDITIR